MHTTEWPVRLMLSEDGDRTVAKLVLTTRDTTITAEGSARRNPSDESVPEIGDEVAAGRAFAELGRQLLSLASTDIAAFADRPASVTT